MKNNKYVVTGPDGKTICLLNSYLANKQKITDEQLEALKLSHQLKWIIFESAKQTSDPTKLKMLANVCDALESEQQALWNFEVNKNFHRFFDFPGCTCPKLDNKERLGTEYAIFDTSCPIHGED